MPHRIYLDNAATSWPKPEVVYAAVDRYQREIGASAGRGAYRTATEAGRVVEHARKSCAALLGVLDPRRIIFTPSATAALNQGIHGLLRSGDHVVTTVCEHNSVLRPLAEAGRRIGVETAYVDVDEAGVASAAAVAAALRPTTRLVVVSHASNVTGAIQPVAEIAAAARAAGAFVLVDAAQSVGHLPIDFHALGVDLLATSGHKGMFGPLGTGVLAIRAGLERELLPLEQGGTGVESQLDRQPTELPSRYESGSLNAPALAGLGAAAELVSRQPVALLAAHESRLTRRLIQGLAALPGVRVHGPPAEEPRAPVVSFQVEGYDPQELAAALDASAGIECRAGLHCAPRMHAALGTLNSGGLVRMSPGWATTSEEIDRTLEVIESLVAV